ncbi:DUF5707 domain-containing protein [Streptomyces sp. NPDC096310]|uniref:DUF5707 domain-containing protein n=1 Tax=Streptomyces sp. NPDC096310 TaxID=3366082 RepID=UPI0037F314BC
MRIRATVAAVSGALALSALAVPASQAAQSGAAGGERPSAPDYGFSAQHGAAAAPKARTNGLTATAKAAAAPVITRTVVNGGKPIVVGTTATKKVTVAITATHASGIADAGTLLWIGKNLDDDDAFGFGQNEDKATCKAANATTSTCTLTVTVDPGLLINTDATYWNVGAAVLAKGGTDVQNDKFTKIRFQRLSKLTVDASPEPVKKGKTLTVTGKLSRANWETATYKGYATQTVKLQFRKKDSSTYTDVKTVNTSSTGTLKTTTTRTTASGYWRWSFAGTASTPAVNAIGDYVAVN